MDLIAREDVGIHEPIRNGDGNEAARRWRVKVERSVRYMVAQLSQDHFDPNLWVTITGKPTRATTTPATFPAHARKPQIQLALECLFRRCSHSVFRMERRGVRGEPDEHQPLKHFLAYEEADDD